MTGDFYRVFLHPRRPFWRNDTLVPSYIPEYNYQGLNLLRSIGVKTMTTLTLSDILDDLRAADQVLRKYEQRYWISSAHFYELYTQGLLDNGEHREDFSEWAGYYKLKQKREVALEQLSQQRLEQLRQQGPGAMVELAPAEPALEIA
jgi:hypothetical protein